MRGQTMEERCNTSVLDLDVLKGVTQDDPEFEREFIRDLIRDCEALFEKMIAVLKKEDLDGFVSLIHQYRGIIQYVAAESVSLFVIDTDDQARLRSTPPSEQEFARLKQDFVLVKQALNQHIQTLGE
jgi:hypothetical protein